jgi:hypothetical protein
MTRARRAKPAVRGRRLNTIAPNSQDSLDLPALPQQWPRWVLLLGPMILALMAAQLWLSGHVDPASALVFAATDSLPWFAALPFVLWLANRFPLDESVRWRNALLHIAAGLTLSLVLPLVAFGLMRSLDLGPAAVRSTGHMVITRCPSGGFDQDLQPPQNRDGGIPRDFPKMRGRTMACAGFPASRRGRCGGGSRSCGPRALVAVRVVLTSMHGWRASRLARAGSGGRPSWNAS